MSGLLSSNLVLRTLSSALLAPPVLACVIVGTPFFEILLLAASVIISVEWSRMIDCGRFRLAGWVMTSFVVLLVAVCGWGLAMPVGWIMILAVAAAVAGLAWWQGSEQRRLLAVAIPVIVLPVVALSWLRQLEGGEGMVLWLLLVVWATDIGAYVSGRTIGGPKLAPLISPKKTWAGLGGGMIWAALVGVGFALPLGVSVLWLAVVSAGLALLAQGGDLAESMVKRRFNLKDSGALIPGHGGLLDRVDGLLAVAPVVFLLVRLMGNPLLP